VVDALGRSYSVVLMLALPEYSSVIAISQHPNK